MNTLRRQSTKPISSDKFGAAAVASAVILKVAVQTDGQQPLLYEFNQKQPLVAIIRDVCSKWALTHPDKYCFQHSDTKEFITEKTRHQLKNGALLRIAELPKITVKEVIARIGAKDDHDVVATLGTLSQSLAEPERLQEFISLDGVQVLTSQILKLSRLIEESLPSTLQFLDKVVVQTQGWSSLTEQFIKYIINLAFESARCGEAAFALLESGLSRSSAFVQVVTSSVTIAQLQALFSRTEASQDSKVAALTFTTTLLNKCTSTQRHELLSEVHKRHIPELIQKTIVAKANANELSSQLSAFQGVCLLYASKKIYTPYDRNNKTHQSFLLSFMMACQASMGRIRPVGIGSLSASSELSEEFPDVDTSRMGLLKAEPAEEFEEVPGGLLALECLAHFALNWSDECDQHFVSNLSRTAVQQCPFVRVGFATIRILADVLGLGEQAHTLAGLAASSPHLKSFYTSRTYFEDLFSVTMQLFNKTWREMGALAVDVDKVAAVVKRQLSLVLKQDLPDLTAVKAGLMEMNYSKISSVIEEEKSRVDDATSQSRPAKELASRIRPTVVELVKSQRLNVLQAGGFFPNWKEKEKKKSSMWYCRLHPNHMVLHWAECETVGNTPVPYDQLTNKILLSDVRELLIGKDCPHVKSSSKKPGALSNSAFALMYNNDEYLGFLTEDERVFASWVDGLRGLLKQNMNEPSFVRDVDMILEMELKIRLLAVENAQIPEQSPPIPADPEDMDFHYKSENDFPP